MAQMRNIMRTSLLCWMQQYRLNSAPKNTKTNRKITKLSRYSAFQTLIQLWSLVERCTLAIAGFPA